MKEIAKQSEVEIISKFQLAIQKSGLNELRNISNKLVYNEDNIQNISDFLDKIKQIEKIIEKVHKEGKAPYWEQCVLWDKNKKVFMDTVIDVKSGVQSKFNSLCLEVERKKNEERQRQERLSRIRSGIEDNLIAFAKKISETTTISELLDVERKVNLEKARKDKYGELYDIANEIFDSLRGHIAAQKEKVRKLELAKNKYEAAIATEDEENIEKVKDKIDELSNTINEQKEEAINAAVDMVINIDVIVPEVIYPDVKARRTVWKFELIDVEKAFKENRSLLDISLNSEAAKGVLKSLKDHGKLDGKNELILNGIRFYKSQTF